MKKEPIEKEQTEPQQYIPYISGSQYDVDMAVLEDEDGNEFVVPLKQVLDYFENSIPITSPLVPCVQSSR